MRVGKYEGLRLGVYGCPDGRGGRGVSMVARQLSVQSRPSTLNPYVGTGNSNHQECNQMDNETEARFMQLFSKESLISFRGAFELPRPKP